VCITASRAGRSSAGGHADPAAHVDQRDDGRLQRGSLGHAPQRSRAPGRAARWLVLLYFGAVQLNEYRMYASKLFEQVSLRADQVLPTFDPEGTVPDDAARLLRMQWRMPVGPVRGLTNWLESAGCIVFIEPVGTPRVDGLSQWIDDHPIILLNSEAPTDRQRWTLAHETGHLCLHSNYIGNDPESEADTFASEFLMPAEVIRPQLRNLSMGRLVDLKRQWGVSIQALVERAYQLRLLTTGQRTSMYKQLSRMGWRIREPISDELASEQPRLTQSIAQALIDKGFSIQGIAKLAGFADAGHNPMFKPAGPNLHVVLGS
jgi:Zn-dependent peptidase ImmA (M78 family)